VRESTIKVQLFYRAKNRALTPHRSRKCTYTLAYTPSSTVKKPAENC
jgi:hypothetical protein